MRASRIYLVDSRDQGETFGVPRVVADIPRSSPGLPVIAVDSSPGRFRGRLYLAWNGERDDLQNVTVARSDDQGETWSARAIKARTSGPAFFSSVAVSKNGTLGLAWIQHESERARAKCWRTYFAASVDGGENFSEPLAVSNALSCPDPTANYKQVRHPFDYGSDYIGLAAAADGSFHVAWPDCRDGAFQVYTARMTVRD